MRLAYPPPGQTMMATPVFFAFSARKTVSVGCVTLVTFILVHCSCLAGPKSPGALAGQTLSFNGSSARDDVPTRPTVKTNADAMAKSLFISFLPPKKHGEMRQ